VGLTIDVQIDATATKSSSRPVRRKRPTEEAKAVSTKHLQTAISFIFSAGRAAAARLDTAKN
jgi:hypothetical protein